MSHGGHLPLASGRLASGKLYHIGPRGAVLKLPRESSGVVPWWLCQGARFVIGMLSS